MYPLLVDKPFLGKLFNINLIFLSSLNEMERDLVKGVEIKGDSEGEEIVWGGPFFTL